MAFLSVDEYGTKAAAKKGIACATSTAKRVFIVALQQRCNGICYDDMGLAETGR
jgi:hypothetical protein